MSKAKLLAGMLVGTALLGGAYTGSMLAETASPSALTGQVTSPVEGTMEGVIVGAKKAGSTITTWVVSNAQGQYSFPRDRMEPGTYAVSIRAVGYELPSTSAEVAAQPTQLDLPLKKIASTSKLAMQLSNAELLLSVPGTEEEKVALAGCVTCHTLHRVLFSRHSAEEFVQVVQRMAAHTNNSSPLHPWSRPVEGPAEPPTARQIALATYLSTINLSSADTFEFPLKTLPRPKGKATEVIYTTYDLPRADAAPHDEAFDAQGNVWYSDFTSQFIGKLDPKTGTVVEYPVPHHRLGAIAQGGLQIDFDKQGRVYFGNMSQMQIVRFDPKTQKITEWKAPTAWTRPYDAQFDDKTYAWTAGMDSDIVLRLNSQTGEFTEYLLPHETNVRHVEVQKSGALSSFWVGDQHGATIIHLEPLAP